MVHTHNWCSSTGEGLGQACAHTVNLVIEMLSPAQKGGCEMCFGIRDGKGETLGKLSFGTEMCVVEVPRPSWRDQGK